MSSVAAQCVVEAACPRIAICGSGIVGPALAGILSKRLGRQVRIDIFERAPEGSDQGYGLDLDEHGQEALVQAGVYDRYWEISKPKSDCVCMRAPNGQAIAILFRPKLLQKFFPNAFAARPESNRGAIRQLFISATEKRGNVQMHYGTPVMGVRPLQADQASAKGVSAVELLGENDTVLGEYDLVVDAMGWNSTLRRHRVLDSVSTTSYAGTVMIHGCITNPAAHGSEVQKLLDRFGTVAMGAAGKTLFFQKFGAGEQDDRTTLMCYADRETADQIFGEIGIEKPTSRVSSIMTGEDLQNVKDFLHGELCASCSSAWHEAIDAVDRITVRPQYTHGGNVALTPACDLPLVCIGDSLANVGIGAGGILGMQDALELSAVLANPDTWNAEGRPSMHAIRALEPEMLQRKERFRRMKEDSQKFEMPDCSFGLYHAVRSFLDMKWANTLSEADSWPLWKRKLMSLAKPALALTITSVLKVFNVWWYLEMRFTQSGPGSTANSPIYTSVKKALSDVGADN